MFMPAAMFVYAALVAFSYLYETDPYLWFDEAGQFWISKGLNHDSAPLSVFGSLPDVVRNNSGYNLDPGGFSVLLHFWSKVSNGYMWLRLLPFTFFALTVAAFVRLFHQWSGSKRVAALAGLVPFVTPLVYKEAFEIRAYSMEVFGVLVAVMAAQGLRGRMDAKRLFLWSCTLSFFMTSRYSFSVVAFATSTYILYLLFKLQATPRGKIAGLAAFALPMLVTLGLVYFYSLRFQNPGVRTPEYLTSLREHPMALFSYPLYLLCLVVLAYIAVAFRNTAMVRKHAHLFYITLATNLLFLVLSFLGKHPWAVDEQRGLAFTTLPVVSYAAVFAELLRYVPGMFNAKYVLLAAVCAAFGEKHIGDISSSRHRDDGLTQMKSIQPVSGKVFVDRWESPCMRYQYEHGALKGCGGYPGNFHFMTATKHGYGNGPKPSLKGLYSGLTLANGGFGDYSVLACPEYNRYEGVDDSVWMPVGGEKVIWVKRDGVLAKRIKEGSYGKN